LSHAVWGVLVESLDTGETLYRLNPDTLVVPASNMKVVSMAAGATRLGWDFRFETRLETRGTIEGNTLRGDLVVVGGGDPSINARSGDREAVFAEWADALRQAGITRIDGRIVGDDNAFDDERYGDGWAWDDFAFGYQAPIGALQFNENVVDVVVRAGASPGEPAAVELRPSVSDLVLVSRVVTGEAAAEADVDIARWPGRAELEVRGVIPAGGKDVVRTAAVDNPTLYFARALREALVTRGIEVSGPAVDIDDLPTPELQELRNIQTREIVEIRYMTGRDGLARYGNGHQNGVIFVVTNRRAP